MKELILRWKDFSMELKRRNMSAHSASIAFFFFLSIVPMLILICTILPHTPLTENDLEKAFAQFVPTMVLPMVQGVITEVYSQSSGIMPIAIIAILWSSSKGVMALMRGLNAMNAVEEKRNFFAVKAIASIYTIIMLLVLIISLLVNVFGTHLVDLILYRFPGLHEFISFLMNFRFVVIWFVFTLLFAMIFTYMPDRKGKFRDQLPGAVFAAIGWNVYSWAFSLYLTYWNGYGIYGSLAIIIIVLLWMYFCMYITLFGAFLNFYRGKELANS